MWGWVFWFVPVFGISLMDEEKPAKQMWFVKQLCQNGVLGILPPKKTKTAVALEASGLPEGYTFSTAA